MTSLVPDSPATEAEHRLQLRFTFQAAVHGVLFALVLGFAWAMPDSPNRKPGPPTLAPVRFEALDLDPRQFAPLTLAGAWMIDVAERRFGGVSGMAIDGGALLLLTDSGSLVRLPKPGTRAGAAEIRDLPSGPGAGEYKKNRDGEALSRDPASRGWWVAFEYRDELWLFDQDFRRVLQTVEVAVPGLGRNSGIEALTQWRGGLLLFSENGDQAAQFAGREIKPVKWHNAQGSLSEATMLPDGSLLLVGRSIGLMGVRNQLLRVIEKEDGLETRLLARLPLGVLDNVEAMAADRRGNRTVRLWLMSDNDFSLRRRTLLLALDLKLPQQPRE